MAFLDAPDRWDSSTALDLYTDASNIGFGDYFNYRYFAGLWPVDSTQVIAELSIQQPCAETDSIRQLDNLMAVADGLVTQALAPSSTKTYNRALASYNSFLAKQTPDLPQTYPSPPRAISAFIAYCYINKLKAFTTL
ncbi:hypothetical protein MAR_016359, partial [Mya arenaria]